MTTEAQSVSGMKPMRTSFFSGASEPAAQAPGPTPAATASAAEPLMKLRLGLAHQNLSCGHADTPVKTMKKGASAGTTGSLAQTIDPSRTPLPEFKNRP